MLKLLFEFSEVEMLLSLVYRKLGENREALATLTAELPQAGFGERDFAIPNLEAIAAKLNAEADKYMGENAA